MSIHIFLATIPIKVFLAAMSNVVSLNRFLLFLSLLLLLSLLLNLVSFDCLLFTPQYNLVSLSITIIDFPILSIRQSRQSRQLRQSRQYVIYLLGWYSNNYATTNRTIIWSRYVVKAVCNSND